MRHPLRVPGLGVLLLLHRAAHVTALVVSASRCISKSAARASAATDPPRGTDTSAKERSPAAPRRVAARDEVCGAQVQPCARGESAKETKHGAYLKL